MSEKTTYEKILETAYAYFATLGYEQTSLSRISKKVGISKPALYYHFGSKEILFETLYAFIIDEMISDYELVRLPDSKEALIRHLIEIGARDIKYVKEKEAFPSILKQYFLLGMRNEKIQKQTLRLEEKIVDYYSKLMEHATFLKIITEQEKEVFTELLVLLDKGILDRAEKLDDIQLNLMWQTTIYKLFAEANK